MAKCNGKSYLCIDKVTLHPQVDIFDALDVSLKKISLWSPNGGIFLKPVKRYNKCSKEIRFISLLATAAKNISRLQAKFSDILCAFDPSTPFLTHFMPLISFDTLLKTSENLWFCDVFRGYQKRSVPWNGLNTLMLCIVSW